MESEKKFELIIKVIDFEKYLADIDGEISNVSDNEILSIMSIVIVKLIADYDESERAIIMDGFKKAVLDYTKEKEG